MSATLVTTVRATEPCRVRNLGLVLDWYSRLEGWELLVIEQGASPMLDSTGWSSAARHVFVPNPGPFNKGWGMNVGSRLASHDLLYFCDADLLVPHAALQTSASLCRGRLQAVNPYDRLIELENAETDALAAASGEPGFDDPRAAERRGRGERLPFCGGSFMMRRALFRRLGGFDERYLGWGAEDDALTVKLTRMCVEIASLESRAAVHLWHPRPLEQTYGNPLYAESRRRLERLQRLQDDELQFLCDVQRQIMGNPDKHLRTQAFRQDP